MKKIIDFGKALSQERAKLLLNQARRELENSQINVEYWKEQVILLEKIWIKSL